MISYLNGRIAMKGAGFAIVDVGGVGYELLMPACALAEIGAVGDDAKVLVSMQVREDSVSLFGFATEEERFVFEKLKTVSGVGPKVALSALSTHGAPGLMAAIASGDATGISKVPGIGKKTAQRMIVDLKGVFDGMAPAAETLLSEEFVSSACQSDAVAALLSMGFTMEEAQLAIGGYTGVDDVEEIIRFALKRLGSF